VFTNLLLADEINRAPAKVQSALLEVMQERQVTIAGETHRVPEPFLVMATQNPIETEGTYPLPEAQVDRFMMKVLVDYPTEEEEFVIVAARHRRPGGRHAGGHHRTARRAAGRVPAGLCGPVADPVRREAGGGHAHARESRPEGPGALHHLRRQSARHHQPHRGARALAMLRGRTYALPEDMTDLVPDVLRHRLVLSYEALSEGLSADAVVSKIMAKIPVPAKPLEHEKLAA
jgi:MoxR-like ATPase